MWIKNRCIIKLLFIYYIYKTDLIIIIMKKQLILSGIIALIFLGSSCQKEKAKQVSTTNQADKLKVNTLPVPTYVDLALIPRQPGEDFDTYLATFHGSSIYFVGPPVYDQAKYPNLVNGVPVFAKSMYGDNYATIDFENSGINGNVFGGTQGTMSITDFGAYHKDLENYFKAVDTWATTGMVGPDPLIYNYVKQSYPTSSGGILFFTGKVIRVTTGTHLAFADINYPLPGPTANSVPDLSIIVADNNNPHISYLLKGKNGQITSVKSGVDNNFIGGATLSASGTYIHTSGTGIYTVKATIIRPDGTTNNITVVNQDLS